MVKIDIRKNEVVGKLHAKVDCELNCKGKDEVAKVIADTLTELEVGTVDFLKKLSEQMGFDKGMADLYVKNLSDAIDKAFK